MYCYSCFLYSDPRNGYGTARVCMYTSIIMYVIREREKPSSQLTEKKEQPQKRREEEKQRYLEILQLRNNIKMVSTLNAQQCVGIELFFCLSVSQEYDVATGTRGN